MMTKAYFFVSLIISPIIANNNLLYGKRQKTSCTGFYLHHAID